MLTPEQRTAEFRRIFEALPGRKIDRIRRVAQAMGCKENTIRIYLLRTNPLPVPEAKLRLLKHELRVK